MKIELIRRWSISTVYRATTRRGRIYFKQSPAFFPNEVPVTVAVANGFPAVSPRVLAYDARNRWMLLDDLGDVTMETADPGAPEGAALWIAAAKSLARIQTASAATPSHLGGCFQTPSPLTGEGWDGGENPALTKLHTPATPSCRGNPCGCPPPRLPTGNLERRSVATTLAAIREWASAEPSAPPSGDLHYAAADTAAALRRLAPLLPRLAYLRDDLTAARLPQALCHGDLDAGNIFIRNGTPILMDWSDACISNPLFDAVQIPQIADNSPIADAYLAEWTAYASMQVLRTAFRAAAPLAALERAIHYRRNIVPHIPTTSDDRSHLEAYVPQLLDRAADLLS